jgi:Zn-finger nucleic acid-binding protein
MNCPIDGQTLVMSERSGIEIDYCPQCRGVWLDRGELDKIIERAASVPQAPAASVPPQPGYAPQSRPQQYDKHGYEQRGYDDRHGSKKKRSSWLSELFDD